MSNGFNFGFGPLLNLLCLIGIDLKRRQSNKCRVLLLFYQCWWLLATITYFTFYFVHLSESHDGVSRVVKEEQRTHSFLVIFCLNELSNFVQPVAIQMLLLSWLKTRWDDLWSSLDALRPHTGPNLDNKSQTRSKRGVVYITSSVWLR